jgi:hypothetical protein
MVTCSPGVRTSPALGETKTTLGGRRFWATAAFGPMKPIAATEPIATNSEINLPEITVFLIFNTASTQKVGHA